ncbi:MAG: universal stress protein [Candidatus Jordarchaeum sp.]|uniref:universal stress protein n=1 Tax=Candidatus Jordarchaeum sp. TaxID=2823881 RepID=UPI00404B8497
MNDEDKLIKKILVALDGSVYSDKVAKYGGDLAQRYNAKITLIHVFEPPTLVMPVGGMETSMPAAEIELTNRIIEEINTKAKKFLNQYKKGLAKGLEVEIIVEKGNISNTILIFAEENNYDLIVVGSRGFGDIKRFFLGSVSDKVSKHAHCPVLIVR